MRWVSVLSLAVVFVACEGRPSRAQAVHIAQQPANGPVEASRRTAITAAVARVGPAVVTVQTEAVQAVPADMLEQMFGGYSAQRPVAGLGSGFIIRPDGVILTNAHVVRGATRVSVALRDGTTYPAKIVGMDDVNDLAVLKVDATGLPVATLGNSSSLLVGEWAIAIGNPYGFVLANTEPSVTVGVVSGVGRNLIAQASEGGGAYVDMIQTDAAINPGNSGGPLVDAAGEVIGVNSSIYSPSGGSIGLGFSIPINRASRVADDILAHGTVRRPWVGVKPAVNVARSPGQRPTPGVVVASVTPGSPAAAAGLQRGDVIVRAATRDIRNPYDWEAELLELRVGDAVPITLLRDGSTKQVSVRVADLPEANAQGVSVLREIELVTLTPAIRAERSIRSPAGAFVRSVTPRVTAAIGLEQGDVIVQVNRTRITTADDAAAALNGTRGPVMMYVERAGQYYSTEFMTQ
ncbi:MAG TPA: trypsin-like peptidase domain-containing protein [Candidatus Elarobacter sp.]|nr:trypsin-like peptidase domain-containing protein [Candidatus Elarobacter sp.]